MVWRAGGCGRVLWSFGNGVQVGALSSERPSAATGWAGGLIGEAAGAKKSCPIDNSLDQNQCHLQTTAKKVAVVAAGCLELQKIVRRQE